MGDTHDESLLPWEAYTPCPVLPFLGWSPYPCLGLSSGAHLRSPAQGTTGRQSQQGPCLLRISTFCSLDSGFQGKASWGAAREGGQDHLLLDGFLCFLLPLLWSLPWPDTEGIRLKRCSYKAEGEELGSEVPPAV